MATLQALRTSAKSLGIPAAEIRKADAEELRSLIMEAMTGGTPKTTTRKKTTPTRKPARSTAKPAKKTTARTPVASKPKPAPAKTVTKRTTSTNGAGRHELGKINYRLTDGWNARPDSVPSLIIATLRKHKGDREAVFEELRPVVFKKGIVGRTMKDGSKRTQASAEDMLRYRIARTEWDFAMKTGQHEKSTNRAAYGEGTRNPNNNGPAKKKTAPARSTAKAARKPAPRKATQTPTRKRTTAQKPAQRRTAPSAKRPVAKKKTRR